MKLHRSLLRGASLLALNTALVGTVITLMPQQALASCTTVNTDTTISASADCITWDSSDISITSGGTITGSVTGISNPGNSVGTLTNSGIISVPGGSGYGISNTGSIGTITNSGSISGAGAGIVNNYGSIGSITNSGVISGNGPGIVNGTSDSTIASTIGAITNSGTLSGAWGIYNSGSTIGTITNNSGGVISGGISAIWNHSGTIGSLSNGGSLSGGSVGIWNDGGSIGAVTNASDGVLTGGSIAGIQNGTTHDTVASTIGTITSSGSIGGGEFGIVNWGGGYIGVITNRIGGGISSGSEPGIFNIGTIGAITNNGDISDVSGYGIGNFGAIGTITNTDSISSDDHGGILNGGSIGAITNSGLISGGSIGIWNEGGSIGTVTNASGGVITGGSIAGIQNGTSGGTVASTIGTITNSGSIGGGEFGILNYADGSIGAITNSITGVISGSAVGIYNNGGDIGVVTNNGTISGGYPAIVNQNGVIGTITNTGIISGPSCCGIFNAGATIGIIANSGTITSSVYTGIINEGSSSSIGTLTNSGSISGGKDGISNSGSIGAITNASGGIIIGGSIAGIANGTTQGTVASTIGAITNSGSISGGLEVGVGNNGASSIGTITNDSSGIITGGSDGIANNGTIGIVTNSGGISGGTNGITNNSGTIGAITNSGSIRGIATGIQNHGGSIGTVTNASGGVIIGSSIAGIQNGTSGGSVASTIGTITNSGSIGGGEWGIVNHGEAIIGTIANNNSGIISATVSGGSGAAAIDNVGTIGSITNSGTISSSGTGIYNTGTIDFIANSIGGIIDGNDSTGIYNNGGSIGGISNSGTINGSGSGIYNTGTIGSITNSGLISAPLAIYSGSGGTILSAITNTGTISGNINVNQDLTITGGNGSSIVTLTGYGTVTGTITANNLTFDSNAYQLLNDDVDVDSGSGTVTNEGTVKVGAASAPTITGNYVGSGATLIFGVTDASEYGALTITGDATLTGSSVSLSGATIAGEAFTIVQDEGTASYASITASIRGFTTSVSSITGIGFDDLVVTAASTNCSIVGGGGNFGNAPCILWNGGNISIASSGVISGSNTGIINTGNSVGTLTNSGSINGSITGLYNSGSIVAIVNTGTITGGNQGIFNDLGGTIGAITNSGTISGNTFGILNVGSIGTLTNSGRIKSPYFAGILNFGGIDVLTNSGSISGNVLGINNAGSIGIIINSRGGFISESFGGSTTGVINNGGTIGALTNSGVISGPIAIWSTGTILSAITNSGTISGDINVSQDLTITGGNASTMGTLTGYQGSIGTITADNLTFDSNAYQLLNDDVTIGSGSGTMTNDGTVKLIAAHSITGNYAQGSSALLFIGVASSISYGNLIITGDATMPDAHVSIGGTLSSAEKFTIVQDSGTADYAGVTATVGSGYTGSVSSAPNGGFDDLVISLSQNGSYAWLGQQGGGTSASGVGGALDQIQTIINNGGDASFAPILTALNALGAQSPGAEATGIKQLAPNQIAPPLIVTNAAATQTARVIGQHQLSLLEDSNDSGSTGRAAGSGYLAGSLWMQAMGGFANSETTTNSDGYHQGFYGLTFGADRHLTADSTLGLALTWVQSRATGFDALAGSAVTQNAYQATAYGTQRFGPAFVDAQAGLGYNFYDESRDIGFLGQSARAAYGGMQYMGKIEGGWDFPVFVGAASPISAMPIMPLHILTVTPLAGFQAVAADNNGYIEHGSSADLTVGQQDIDSYETSLGGQVKTTFTTEWGSLTPEFKAAWVHDLSNTPISTQATLGGVGFTTETPRVAADGAQITFAATLQATDAITLRAEYDGDLRAAYQSQSGLVKFEWSF